MAVISKWLLNLMVNDEVLSRSFKRIIIASGNDACVALAEGIDIRRKFSEMMNEKP